MRIVACILAVAIPATASADPLFNEAVQNRSAAAIDGRVKWRRTADPQALATVLVRTKLLETLHHFDAAPKDRHGALDVGAMKRLGALAADGRHYAFLLEGDTLRAAMVRIPVPVEPERADHRGWTRDRLAARKRALSGLSRYRLKPSKKDEYGNVFEWKGRTAGGRVFVRYQPDVDELVALFVSG